MAVPVLDSLGLDAALLGALDRRTLRLRRPLPGGEVAGTRRARGAGESVEVSDHRAYAPGDDLRRVDWGAFARSDRLSVRLGLAEREATVTLVVDRSRSMEFGEPVSKADRARSIAAAMAWVAVQGGDRVAVAGVGSTVVRWCPPVRGRVGVHRAWRLLASLPVAAAGDPAALVALAPRLRPGLCVVLSDFMTTADWGVALRALRGARQEVLLIQVLSAAELDPELAGDLRLRDSESGAAVEVSATPAVLRAYRQALDAHTARLGALARGHGATFLRVVTTTPLRTVLLADMPRAGALR
ncbi:MAG TPA: DUF58 domain-containing protein [Candidatus Dormibacteraeota bacterium]|jgi:uncharacterized protein (DUF58 family)|nr:DUF58 domain-containing protein [Candidatus Dormibacteraeota bacterium]